MIFEQRDEIARRWEKARREGHSLQFPSATVQAACFARIFRFTFPGFLLESGSAMAKDSEVAFGDVSNFLATAITLLEGYPWLSIYEESQLDPANPLPTLFNVANEGHRPASRTHPTAATSTLS